jgi:hypothetical protein
MHFMTDARLKKLAKMIVQEVIAENAHENKHLPKEESRITETNRISGCKKFCECREYIHGDLYCSNCSNRYNMIHNENTYRGRCKTRCYIIFNSINSVFVCSNCLVNYKKLDQAS